MVFTITKVDESLDYRIGTISYPYHHNCAFQSYSSVENIGAPKQTITQLVWESLVKG